MSKNKHCADCDNYNCRCSDCIALVEHDDQWFCDEIHQFCEKIKVCNEWSVINE